MRGIDLLKTYCSKDKIKTRFNERNRLTKNLL